MPRISRSSRRDLAVGSISGAFTTSIGMPGPPILLYFSGFNTTKEKLRGTTLTFYLWIYLVSLGVQVVFAGTSKEVWTTSAAALPIVIAGLILGQFLFKFISQELFRILTYVLLFFSGAYLFVQQL